MKTATARRNILYFRCHGCQNEALLTGADSGTFFMASATPVKLSPQPSASAFSANKIQAER